ncbi:MAG: bifunctional (p)ppGpp synthetase/guanosine-3',5'-bis(diphosphate) 3'-pyrophosphohydrolase [Synechococcaceae cyanobacterium RL_1_2]|nr:bifunctional (p)ppGpp synthetase/guanosine-3',5'-bis(diphosphate) 3'-pyrophosphohydrolase [Synechococcaceae cyanobacterium RL_1_2]
MATSCPPTPFSVELPDWLQTCLSNPQSGDDNLVCRSFNYAYQLHQDQFRKSGEPYIAHPVAVASVLRDLQGGSHMIAAGFLHDVVEDTDVTTEDIREMFGDEVAHLVDGVTKLSKFNFSSNQERQAENFRRMFLAMAEDVRVIVVKLADRLHNMRTLEHVSPEKQVIKAKETRDIFAPLANRLGIWRIKWELEDLCFKYLEPEDYQQVKQLISDRRINREQKLRDAIMCIRLRLDEMGLKVYEIKGRPKHLYGIYNKMKSQHKGFDEIFDIAGIRIIVDTKDECYRALAVVHDEFKPIPNRFKDYIGLPKANLYQSLHTTVIGLNGRPLEVQIRTLEMHQVAEYGIAAHWKYKETGGSSNTPLDAKDEKFSWLRQLLEWQNDLKDAQEYVDNLRDNLFEDDVYVFTPRGDLIALAHGSTSVDFAYRIHTEVGNQMKGVRINGQWSVLDTKLKNGDIVEIITQKNTHPSADWLNFVVTPGARNKIRQWYKRFHREENINHGRELLERELGKRGLDALLKSDPMLDVAKKCNYQSVDDLLAALGYGEVTINQVVNRIRDFVKTEQKLHEQPDKKEKELIADLNGAATIKGKSKPIKDPIIGVEGLLHHMAGCCHPLPGEPIVGVVTRDSSKGISIHRQGCSNLDSLEPDRLLPVSWNPNPEEGRPRTYPVNLKIQALDRVGVFKDILAKVSDQKINIRNAGVKTGKDKPAIISLSIDICDRHQLEHTISQIRKMGDILNVCRVQDLN